LKGGGKALSGLSKWSEWSKFGFLLNI